MTNHPAEGWTWDKYGLKVAFVTGIQPSRMFRGRLEAKKGRSGTFTREEVWGTKSEAIATLDAHLAQQIAKAKKEAKRLEARRAKLKEEI